MKAIRFHEYGGPEVLRFEEAPNPHTGPRQVLIRVHAAGVNPVDWKLREGRLRGAVDLTLPIIPGGDMAGIVETVGSGVEGFKTGDDVYGMVYIGKAAYAELVAVDASQVAAKPTSLDYVHAAAVPIAGLTAWQALFDWGHLEAGQKVLIHAAAGGVGTFAVQLARWKGAYVIGTASARNADFLRELGADEVIDYHTTRFEDVVTDADVVLDAVGGETQERSWKALKKGGILVSIVSAPSEEAAAAHGVRCAVFMTTASGMQLAQIAGLIDAGHVKVDVETILPLAEARRAHELSESGHTRGKIVLQVHD
jgi:NADPH:quinone reductase-like Zn-dependent oxidoreductase